jgi:hypothetical protein
LIGSGCDCLIPANPPKGAKPGKRGTKPPKATGHCPGRKAQQRRREKLLC